MERRSFLSILCCGFAHIAAGTAYSQKGTEYKAIDFSIDGPVGMISDGMNGLLVAEMFGSHRLLRLEPSSGIATIIAGPGGLCDSVRLENPTGLAVSLGQLFVIEALPTPQLSELSLSACSKRVVSWNNSIQLDQIRAITALKDGSIFLADGMHRILRLHHGDLRVVLDSPTGLHFPSGLALDNRGALFIADTQNHVVRRFDPNNNVLSIIAGTGKAGYSGDSGLALAAQLNQPWALAVDSEDNLFVGEAGRIRMIRSEDKTISTVAGNGGRQHSGDGGLAKRASFMSIGNLVVVDRLLYFTDTSANRIRRVDLRSGLITTIGGNGLPKRKTFNL